MAKKERKKTSSMTGTSPAASMEASTAERVGEGSSPRRCPSAYRGRRLFLVEPRLLMSRW